MEASIAVFMAYMALICFILWIGGAATKYVIEYWCSKWKKKKIDAPLWVCIIIAIFVGEFTIPGAIITWALDLIGVIDRKY